MSTEPYREERIRITTREKPLEVRLDPHHVTWDWDRRNDTRRVRTRFNFDWPFLEQVDRERMVALLAPIVWYSEPGGVVVSARYRDSYLGFIDKYQAGLGYNLDPRQEMGWRDRIPFWTRLENPTLRGRPRMGFGLDLAAMDVLGFARLRYASERKGAQKTLQYGAALTTADVGDLAHMPEQWDSIATVDLRLHGRFQRGRPPRGYAFLEAAALGGLAENRDYLKGEVSAGVVRLRERTRLGLRGYAGATTHDIPGQRAVFVSSADPLSTFYNHWWRPRGALLKRPGMNWLPLGGAALRGFRWDLADRTLAGGNVEVGFRVAALPVDGAPWVWLNAFGDLAYGDRHRSLSDAGIGIALRGLVYDREITIRLDAPFFVNRPDLGIERDGIARDRLAARWVLSFNDIW